MGQHVAYVLKLWHGIGGHLSETRILSNRLGDDEVINARCNKMLSHILLFDSLIVRLKNICIVRYHWLIGIVFSLTTDQVYKGSVSRWNWEFRNDLIYVNGVNGGTILGHFATRPKMLPNLHSVYKLIAKVLKNILKLVVINLANPT